jgi:hypothetical protein
VDRRVDVEKQEGRPAWEVRRDGALLGVVWREGRTRFRAASEGKPLSRSFATREDAVDGLVREARRR